MASVVLDAGHGGSDPGAVYNGRQEKDDTLRLAKAVGAILERNGVDVSYTRTDDRYDTPLQKAQIANATGADYLISIHRNSSIVPNTYSGTQTLVYSDTGVRSRLARNINNELVDLGFRDAGIVERPNLVVLRRSSMPAALIEVGFINNDKDNQLFDEKFNEIAQGIADGILTTLYGGQGDQGEITEDHENNQKLSKNEVNRMDYEENLGMSSSSVGNVSGNAMGNVMGNTMDNMNDGMGQMNMMDRHGMENRDMVERMVMPRNMENMSNMANMTNMDGGMDDMNRKLYRVQVGAYQNKENADRMLNSLLSDGFPAFMIFDDGLYKVQVGAYEFLPNAIRMENNLRRYRYNTYITT